MRFRPWKFLPATVQAKIIDSRVLIGRLGWTTTSYFIVQVIRFSQNLLLTRLLAPELFGVMVVLTSLRVGAELFTDIGIGQNVIASPRGWDPTYYNTAWTMQMLRGFILALLFLALMPALSYFYADPTLNAVFPVLSALFILSGMHSIGLTLSVKAMKVKELAKYDVIATGLGSVVALAIAWVFPTVWGLIAGNVAATVVSSTLSYFVWPNLKFQLRLDRQSVREIFSFGKWIFLSSIIFFLAAHFDRLVLSKYVSLAALGVYGVARSLGDIFGQLTTRLGNSIIFPSISSANFEGKDLRRKIGGHRFLFLGLAAAAISLFIALSDVLIRVLYDDRYLAAGQVLPWVGLSTWLLVINTVSESVLLGIRKPNYTAVGNSAKFIGLLCLLAPAALNYGIIGAAIATIVAEFARYAVLTVGMARQHVHFFRQDLVATGGLLLGAMVFKEIVYALNLTPTPLPFAL
jgi:O-antigen/teichoic acid export membrane protein